MILQLDEYLANARECALPFDLGDGQFNVLIGIV